MANNGVIQIMQRGTVLGLPVGEETVKGPIRLRPTPTSTAVRI